MCTKLAFSFRTHGSNIDCANPSIFESYFPEPINFEKEKTKSNPIFCSQQAINWGWEFRIFNQQLGCHQFEFITEPLQRHGHIDNTRDLAGQLRDNQTILLTF